MRKLSFKYFVISAILLCTQAVVFAQSPFHLDKTASKITILGTSSVHDWEVEVSEFKCDATISTAGTSVTITKVNVVCEVKDVESDNRIMTGKIYKALDGDKHPQISFTASETVTVSTGSEANIKGKLTIAGQTKEVTLPFKLTTENGSVVKAEGKLPLKMSDFKIDPPTAMMGALKTGDAIELNYNVVLNKK